uniref:Uncharacterized protein n=1 Tax=Mola mola TaxID=94237 RepID=A0A3Q3W5N7_MOLML
SLYLWFKCFMSTSHRFCPQNFHSLLMMVDDVQVGYGDSNMKVAEAKQDWMRMLIKYEPQNLEWYTHDENGEVKGFNQCSYDVEDFIVLDLDCSETPGLDIYFVHVRWTQLFLSSLSRAPHSVSAPEESLLSSPVSCHATSFYPNRAPPLRRKDGDDLHENVDHGEILPNPDGTFQMSVDLNLSSVKPEDWGKYDLTWPKPPKWKGVLSSCEPYSSKCLFFFTWRTCERCF